MGERPWKIGGDVLDLSQRAMIMGVLNVTPDSFSDGGKFLSVGKAVERGAEIAAEGAHIVDVGGESTRPGAEPVSVEEELRRVIPVIEGLREKIKPIVGRPLHPLPEGEEDATAPGQGLKFISIDTSKSEVADAALAAGASIVNDVTGGRGDNKMMQLIARRKAAFIIMHMQGTPRTMQKAPHYLDVVTEVADFFRQQYGCALECGIDPMAIAFDPGIGFGKTLQHNLQLLENLERRRYERPAGTHCGIDRATALPRSQHPASA
jgi:dihydropteroate synthase